MNMTPREQSEILKKYRWLVGISISGYRKNLSWQDFEELEADCLYAIFRAIEAYDPNHPSGATVETLIGKYINQTIKNFVQRMATKRRIFEAGTISADQPVHRDDPTPLVDYFQGRETGDESDRAIVISSLLNAIDNPRKKMIISAITKCHTEAEVAKSIGVTPQRVSQIKTETISEVRKKMQDREDWGYWSEGAVK